MEAVLLYVELPVLVLVQVVLALLVLQVLMVQLSTIVLLENMVSQLKT